MLMCTVNWEAYPNFIFESSSAEYEFGMRTRHRSRSEVEEFSPLAELPKRITARISSASRAALTTSPTIFRLSRSMITFYCKAIPLARDLKVGNGLTAIFLWDRVFNRSKREIIALSLAEPAG
jgi:hypothetical protein